MIYFIVNPAAGNGKAVRAVPYIRKEMEKLNKPYRIFKTKSSGAAAKLMKAAIDSQKAPAEAVIIVGGDGTLQEAVQAIIGAAPEFDITVPLGILPLGSGNDFVNGLMKANTQKKNFSVKKTVEKFLPFIVENIDNASTIDAVRVNGKVFLNMASIGLDCEVAEAAAQKKRRYGRFAYLIALLQIMLTYRGRRLFMTIDGQKTEGKFTLLAIANGRQYGGGFLIAPMAEPADGLLTLCLIDVMPPWQILVFFPLVLFGRHGRLRQVKFLTCRELTVHNASGLKMNLDGNIFTFESDLHIQIIPQALKVIGLS